MIVKDWRFLDAARMAALYHSEEERWRRTLLWETRGLWRSVDEARTTGRLLGRIACDLDGTVAGWGFFLRHRQVLQIGGLVSSSEEVTEALVGAILASPEAACASRSMIFGYCEAPGLGAVLESHGFAAERYRYLKRPVCSGSCGTGRVFQFGDLRDLTALAAASYPSLDPTRPFAPGGAEDEWTEYVTQLTFATGCGEFDPATSLVVANDNDGLDGAALITRLSPDTAHLAQLMVRPDAQGRGLGRRLLAAAIDRAGANGYRWMTLLVGEQNGPARRLYRRFGFTDAAAFVSAGCDQPCQDQRRSSQPSKATQGPFGGWKARSAIVSSDARLSMAIGRDDA